MAKIDQGGFGYQAPKPTPGAVAIPGEAFDTSGVNNLISGVRQVAASDTERRIYEQHAQTAAFERSRREIDHKIEQENRARSTAAMVDYDVGVRQVGETVSQQLQSGEIERADVSKRFTEEEGKIRAAALKDIPPDQQEFIAPRLAKAAGRIQFGLDQVVEQHRKSTILGYADRIRDGMAKQAAEPGANVNKLGAEFSEAMHVLGPDGGLKPAQVEKVVQDFKDKATSDYLVARLNDNFDDLNGLKDLKKQLGKSRELYPNLDPERKNVLLHQINSAISRLENKGAADASRVLAELGTDLSNAEKSLLDGYVLGPELMLGLQKRTKGTPMEPHFARLAGTNAYVSQFVNAPIARIQGAILELDAKVRQSKDPGELAGGISIVNSLRQLAANKARGLKDNPYEQAVKDGAPYVDLDFSTPELLESTVRSRVAAVKGQAQQNPGASQSIFQEAEARAFKAFAETQSPAAVAGIMGRLTKSVNDPVVIAHSFKDLSKESPMLAQAGWMASLGQMPAAIAILEGDAILNNKDVKQGSFQMPSDEKLRDGWRSRVGDAYGGKIQAEDMEYQAAKNIYAALAKHQGKTSDKEVNGKLWKRAIDMSTGGVAEYNDRNVVLPYGLAESDFRNRAHEALDKAFNSREIAGAALAGTPVVGKKKDRLEGLDMGQMYHQLEQDKINPPAKDQPDQVEGGQLTRDYLKDLPLESIGQGQYRVVRDTGYVVNDAGYPLILDLRQANAGYRWDAGNRVGMPVKKDDTAATRALQLPRDPDAIPLSPDLDEGEVQPLSKPDMKKARRQAAPKKGEK